MGLSQKSWEMTNMLHTTTGAQLRLWLDEPKSDDEGMRDGGHNNNKLSCVQDA